MAGLVQSRTVLTRWSSLCLHWDALRVAPETQDFIWVMYMCATGSRTAPKGCEVLGQPYVFQKQWWGPPQGLERLSRAGLSQNPHLLYYYPSFWLLSIGLQAKALFITLHLLYTHQLLNLKRTVCTDIKISISQIVFIPSLIFMPGAMLIHRMIGSL